jgi:hypothetical protein
MTPMQEAELLMRSFFRFPPQKAESSYPAHLRYVCMTAVILALLQCNTLQK